MDDITAAIDILRERVINWSLVKDLNFPFSITSAAHRHLCLRGN